MERTKNEKQHHLNCVSDCQRGAGPFYHLHTASDFFILDPDVWTTGLRRIINLISTYKKISYLIRSIAVNARSKPWVCGRTLAEIAGSNPAGGMDVCLLRMLCVVK